MQITQTKNEGLEREYTVVIDAESIENKLNDRLKTLSRNVKMRGFRPGKVPVSLLKKLHGKNLMGEVLEETVTESSQKLLSDEELRAAFQPKIEIVKFDEGSDLEYAMSVEVLPQFEIADLSGLELERLTAPVADQEIDDFLTKLADQQKTFKAAKSKTYKSKSGDAVLIDFVGRLDGELFDGGTGTDFQLELGSGMFVPGFEDQLEGVKAGAKVEVKVRFPDAYDSENLAGRDVVFDVDVKEVQKPDYAQINDDLAKQVGVADLEALKKVAGEQIEREHARHSKLRIKRSLLDIFAEQYDFEVPKGMLDLEFNMIWKQLTEDLERHGEDISTLGKSEDEAKEEYRGIALRRVRLGLLLSEIGSRNDIEVRQDELNRLIAEEARRHPGQEKQVFDHYKNDPEAASQLRAPLLEDKVVDYVVDLAKVSEREIGYEELLRDPDDEEVAAAKPKRKAKSAKKPAAKKPAVKKPAAKKKPAAAKKPAVKKTAKIKKSPALRKSPAKGKAKAKSKTKS